jgi:hypothetical protein
MLRDIRVDVETPIDVKPSDKYQLTDITIDGEPLTL